MIIIVVVQRFTFKFIFSFQANEDFEIIPSLHGGLFKLDGDYLEVNLLVFFLETI